MPEHIDRVVDVALKVSNAACLVIMYTHVSDHGFNTTLKLLDERRRYCDTPDIWACGLLSLYAVCLTYIHVRTAMFVVPALGRGAIQMVRQINQVDEMPPLAIRP